MSADAWSEWRAKQTPTFDKNPDVSFWRRRAAQVCAEVVKAHVGTEDELRAALRAAYPFGGRKHWPYKCWLAEQDAAIRAWRIGNPVAAGRDEVK